MIRTIKLTQKLKCDVLKLKLSNFLKGYNEPEPGVSKMVWL